ncbi:hypothetical protein, partial [Streptomyces sp. GbtcB6]|uniref:hypothetical protein n=1 Tax=Streptomyces sp. GbtcB6 TaxID=2824751 RepID=UPI001C2F7B12
MVWYTYEDDQSKGDLGSTDPAVVPASGADPMSLGLFPQDQDHREVGGAAYLVTAPTSPGELALATTVSYVSS